ncbi:hypothetical protein GCM10011416_16030 [Polaribacter pacificus]|uniref:MG2 domain-containing protein n=1 Tax=Polaribacter pacificus TaxID=1775173 RepID=A0A917HZ07_9FLAO|nr:hypothetical protein [Polaribacter pacificus]GGG98625.1 hypothetical protein GCM10011416_16030 [Polaribacter pacificus]
MKKSQLVLLLAVLLKALTLQSQVTVSKSSIDLYQKLDIETVYLQQNSKILFAGEQLLYKVYVLNTAHQASISKIAYVALVNSDKKTVFTQKLRIDESTGAGSFTIPYTLDSGTYQLVAYTQWMRNTSDHNYFHSPLHIINPFSGDQSGLQIVEKNTPVDIKDISQGVIAIKVDKEKASKRQLVQLSIEGLLNQKSYGNYIVSVRKKPALSVEEPINISNYVSLFKNNKIDFTPTAEGYKVYSPEIKGELISGVVRNTENNQLATNVKVALSIPSKNFVFKTAKTNAYGVFYIDLEHDYNGDRAVIQVVDDAKEKYRIQLYKTPDFYFDKLSFPPLKVSEAEKDWIANSVEHLQIENAYRSVKQDSIVPFKEYNTFYNIDYKYNLDDFTRFKTVEETMIEIVEHTWVNKKDDNYSFHVRDYKSGGETRELPLVLIDGVQVQNHNDLYHYDVKKIQTINIITDKFLFNNQMYGGVILVETKKTDFIPISKGAYLHEFTLKKPEPTKIYYQPDYKNASNLRRVPDERSQLLWVPDFTLTKNSQLLNFYTSDNTGLYEILVEGFTFEGKAVSIRKTIEVR